MKIFIQQKNGEWFSSAAYACWFAFSERGDEIIPFTYNQLCAGELAITKDTIVHGSVGAVRKALNIIDVKEPRNFDLPESLLSFIGRKTWLAKLSDIRQIEKYEPPIHIKPFEGHKLFTGTVLKRRDDLLSIANISGDIEVLVQEYVDFVSEYRTYVLKKQAVGFGNYSGNPLILPDSRKISDAIDAFIDAPIAYSLDFGVTASGETLLVEANDAFSLGCYGCNAFKYTQMVEARWFEMTYDTKKIK